MTKKTCRRCGVCCEQIPIVIATQVDVDREPRIATECSVLRGTGDPARGTGEPAWTVALAGKRPCPFLVKYAAPGVETSCLIHPTRPAACVALESGGETCRMLRAQAGLAGDVIAEELVDGAEYDVVHKYRSDFRMRVSIGHGPEIHGYLTDGVLSEWPRVGMKFGDRIVVQRRYCTFSKVVGSEVLPW